MNQKMVVMRRDLLISWLRPDLGLVTLKQMFEKTHLEHKKGNTYICLPPSEVFGISHLTRDEGCSPVLSEVVQAATVGREGCSVGVTNGSKDVNILQGDGLGHCRSGGPSSSTQTGECLLCTVTVIHRNMNII